MFFFFISGDPQEECVRCGKVYLASSNELNQGFCGGCLTNSRDQVAPFRSSGESGTEEDSSNGSPA